MKRKEFLKHSSMASVALFSSPFKETISKINGYSRLNIGDTEMANICRTCGTRYSKVNFQEDRCHICLDDRQYVKNQGQKWISFNDLHSSHAIKVKQHSEQLFEIIVLPNFAIGQRAFFIKTEEGNILWDCIPLISEPVVDFIKQNGGLKAIAVSHPHYYSLMNEWAKAFDCPIYLHEADKMWVMDESKHIKYWSGKEKPIFRTTKIIHTGGHFAGSTIIQTDLNDLGKTMLVGDTLQLSRDHKHISVMYSYPNFIPLSNSETLLVLNQVNQYAFNAMFGAFDHQNIYHNAKVILENSIKNYESAFNL